MNSFKIIGIIVVVVILGLLAFFTIGNREHRPESSQQVITSDKDDSKSEGLESIDGYRGQLIAGQTSPYLVFHQADYERATSEGKVIFLDFYANWCPICRAEAPEIMDGFNALENTNVVGFRVNYNDSETNDNEDQLAEELNVPNQYTKLILKDGKEIYRSRGESWNKDTVLEELSSI